jgi:4a-hydroxytetrahydrobiopterin dehydratase
MELTAQNCIPCTGKEPHLTPEEIAQIKPEIPDWQIIEVQGESRLERIYKFPDFQTALDFTNKVGEAAENQGHHPALLTEWGKVTVTWWTHAISGLHQNDFIMAAKTNQIAAQLARK